MNTCPLCGRREGVGGATIVFEHQDGQRSEVGPGETLTLQCPMTLVGEDKVVVKFSVGIVLENREGVLKITGPTRAFRWEGG